MTASPLICARCDREILPGAAVDFVGMDDDSDQRIFLEDELLVVHATCDSDSTDRSGRDIGLPPAPGDPDALDDD